jgi:hypothetical protein
MCPLEEEGGGFAALVEGVQETQEVGCQANVERAGLLEGCRKKRWGQ